MNLSDQLKLVPVQTDDQSILFQLMETIYKSAYSEFWEDGGDWYLNLIYNPRQVEKELARSRSHYFFVEWNDQKIGILKYDYPFSPREISIPNAMKLHRLYLHQDSHGKGVAKQLIHHCEAEARRANLDFIWLEAMSKKPQAKRFYEKMGFETIYQYTLSFDLLLPENREIEIMRKRIS